MLILQGNNWRVMAPFSSVQVQKSSAVVQRKSYVPSSRGEYVITKLDDLVNWARRVSPRATRLPGIQGQRVAHQRHLLLRIKIDSELPWPGSVTRG